MKIIALILTMLFMTVLSFAQAPDSINYQAVARDLSGNPLVSTPVTLQFDIVQGSLPGSIVYAETHAVTTNQFGLFTIAIGGGTPVLGTFSGISWGTGLYHLRVTVNGDVMPETKLLSVPFALHANTASTGIQGANGHANLADSIAILPGIDCANGGYQIFMGVDDNDDGILQLLERDINYFICNGLDGSSNNNDTSATNEIQILSINLTNDTIFLSNGGGFIPLPAAAADNDWQVNGVNMILDPVVTGNVGVGTSVPLYKLSVVSSDSIVASFRANNPNFGAIAITTPNPTTPLGLILLSGGDTAIFGLDPVDKILVMDNSVVGGHIVLNTDSSIVSYGEVIGNIAQSQILNQSPAINNVADTIYSSSTTGEIINVNAGTFYTDSLYVLGTNMTSNGYVLTNDGNGQAQWKVANSGIAIKDADGDTEINVEASADQDIIHFSLGNSTGYTATEYFTMIGPRLEVLNSGGSIFIGQGSGANDDLSLNNNVFVGNNAGATNTSGDGNIAVGGGSLFSNTIGALNTAVGLNSLNSNTDGGNNTAIGSNTLKDNITGSGNTAIGAIALASNIIGANNTAVGEQSLTNNLSGQQNTSVGFQTLRSNTNGGNNNAVGYEALRTNTTGFNNVAIGHTSLYVNLIGNNNVALGSRSGRNSVGSGNVFIGNDAGFNELGSDKLYIENSTSSTPLIWGDFANDSLKINGTLSVLDGTQGTSGNVLTDDGFGNATWQTPISGGWSLLGNSGTNPASNGIGTSDAQDLVFLTNGAERMRITQTGNVGIGIIPNPIANLHIAAAGQAITAIQASHNGVADQSGMLTFLRSRGTINVPTGILGGDRLGKLEFNGWDGSSWSEAASIKAVADENFTIGTRGTRVEFHTTPIGTNTSSEVMRLLDNGDISLAMTGGDVRVSNAYFMPNVDGVANQVLTTNGAGVTSWQTPAGGSLWNLNGSDINYMTGRVGIGIVTPVSSFNIIYTGIDTEASLVNYTNNSAAGIGTGYFVGANNTGIGSITAAGFTVNTSSNSSETKAIDANNIANGTTNYGIKSVAIGVGLDNYGGDFSASGGSSTNTAIRALAEASGTSQATGIYATAQGATNNTTYGVYGQNASSTTGAAYAGYFQNLNSTGSGTYGVRSNVSSTNTNNQYGFYAGVNSGGGGTKYGLYSSVTGGTTNWAGYFAAGDVYIGAGLVIPTNAGAGKVLTSDATGNATWKTGQIAFEAVPAGVGQNFNSVPQSVDLSVGTFNMGGAYNFSGSEFIAPVSGVYSFQCQITVKGQSASPSLNFTLEMLKNSASFKTSTNEISDTDSETVTINITMSLIAGDKISFQAYHDVIGGFVVATSSIQNTWFSGHLVFEN